jgi:hypothetical protein
MEWTKWVWSGGEFDEMGWHDVPIHAVAWVPEAHEFVLDIDYIVQWVDPAPDETHYSFWIVPATLVFEGVFTLSLDVGQPWGATILDVERTPVMDLSSEPRVAVFDWTLDCVEGAVTLRATGFTQYIRRPPMHVPRQRLSASERGGLSFSRSRDL